MPLTETGRKALKSFIEQYDGERGTRFFYAYMRKYPKKTRSWHE